MGDDRESHLDEIRRRVRERAQLLESFAQRAPPQLVDDQRADAFPAFARIDRQRADFGDVGAQRRELGAADDAASARRDDESRGVNRQLAERARQEVTLLEAGRNEGVQGPGFRCLRRAQTDATP